MERTPHTNTSILKQPSRNELPRLTQVYYNSRQGIPHTKLVYYCRTAVNERTLNKILGQLSKEPPTLILVYSSRTALMEPTPLRSIL